MRAILRLFAASALAPISLAVLLATVVRPSHAAGMTYFASASGAGTSCAQASPCALSTAVGKALNGDTIYVAGGSYGGTGSAVVVLTESVALLGGWNGSASGAPVRDPAQFPSRLDGQRARRVVLITGNITPTLDGFEVVNGNASDLNANCGAVNAAGCGGGIFVYQSHPVISNNIISGNFALLTTTLPLGRGFGGGIYLETAPRAVISNNLVISNSAAAVNSGDGGGIYVKGAGLNSLRLQGNRLIRNSGFQGGGIALVGGEGNYLAGNSMEANAADYGAAVYVWDAGASLVTSRMTRNSGTSGVIHLAYFRGSVVQNQLVGNMTNYGIWSFNGVPGGYSVVNNIIAGSGIHGMHLQAANSFPLTMSLYYNTIVGSGAGDGININSGFVYLELVNNLFSGVQYAIHNQVPTSTVNATHTFFDSNVQYLSTFTNMTFGYVGNPRFLDAGAGNYHITLQSGARNKGLETLVDSDVDGRPRAWDGVHDIGADEAEGVWLPLIRR